MTWWAWVLIWLALVLGLFAMLGLCAWLLFRKFITLMDDLSDLADRSALLEPPDSDLVAPPIAVLADPRDMREREAARRGHRAERRWRRHESRIARGKAITSLDPESKAALVTALSERWSAPRVG
ncbi:MAG: hypothetical protein Q8M65_08970 [Rhodoglobus sp.]|nr:hypothetical protein [Rhodoglobus sp.]